MLLATAFTVGMAVYVEMGLALLYFFFYDIRLRLWSLLLRVGVGISMVYGGLIVWRYCLRMEIWERQRLGVERDREEGGFIVWRGGCLHGCTYCLCAVM
jgi:hypothetical protein